MASGILELQKNLTRWPYFQVRGRRCIPNLRGCEEQQCSQHLMPVVKIPGYERFRNPDCLKCDGADPDKDQLFCFDPTLPSAGEHVFGP